MTRHLLVIGAQRCGTTYLGAHPRSPSRHRHGAAGSAGAEGVHVRRARGPRAGLVPRDLLLARDNGVDPRREEHELPRVRTMRPNARLRCSVRSRSSSSFVIPFARAVSNWRFSSKHGLEDRPLAQALEETLEAPRAWDPDVSSVSPFAYLERGRYLDYLEPWYADFPDTVHVRFLEDVIDTGRPQPTSTRRSASIRASGRPTRDERVNESEGTAPELDEALVRRLRDLLPRERPAAQRTPRPAAALAFGLTAARYRIAGAHCRHPVQPRLRRGRRAGVHPAVPRERHTSSSGPFSKRSVEMLRDWSGAEDVLLTTSCTSALELSALMLDLKPGDTVIVPSFTFTTTALAFARQGAQLLFCDIEPETLGHRRQPPGDAARRQRAGRRARPLRGRRLRHRRHPQGARRPARRGASSRTTHTGCSAAGTTSRSAASAGSRR